MKHTLLILAFAAGCSFNPGKGSVDLGAGGDDGGMSDGGGDDMGPGGPDLAQICTPGNKTCSNATLSTCNPDGTGVDTSTCVLGCNAAGNDCQALQPTPPAVSSDFSYQGLSELTIAASQTLLVFDTDTGAIVDGSGAVVRMPNATPMMRNVEDGIGFHRTAGVGIWTFSKLTVPATTTIVFKNPFAASILSAGDLTIAGTIDARGYADPTKALMTPSTLCQGTVAGPGGTIGGTAATVAMGTGAGGGAPDPTTGGGGAGYGDVGGAGGKNGGTNGGTAGAIAGTAAINPLAAGFGGGASGGPPGDGDGGGGGGALQLAAEGTLTVSGKINAGGCGGAAGDATHGGGGGGSGGAVLLESPTVHVTSTGVLTANGGGGGGGGDAMTTAGAPGGFGNAQAAGGMPGNNGSGGGQGGSVNSTMGDPGSNGKGGGGGGGVGRVRLNSRTGATLDMSPIVSPAPSQGTVTIQ